MNTTKLLLRSPITYPIFTILTTSLSSCSSPKNTNIAHCFNYLHYSLTNRGHRDSNHGRIHTRSSIPQNINRNADVVPAKRRQKWIRIQVGIQAEVIVPLSTSNKQQASSTSWALAKFGSDDTQRSRAWRLSDFESGR